MRWMALILSLMRQLLRQAKKSFERNTGARGLRAILESVMRDVMFNIPSDENISKCTITEESVVEGKEPLIEYKDKKE